MKITQEIQERSEQIQKELQNIVGTTVLNSTNFNYQDSMNVAIFVKLAELELKQEELTKWLAEVNIKLINNSK